MRWFLYLRLKYRLVKLWTRLHVKLNEHKSSRANRLQIASMQSSSMSKNTSCFCTATNRFVFMILVVAANLFFTPNVHFISKEKIRIEYINKHSDIFRSCILWFKFKFNANNKNPIQNVWMFEYLLWMLLSNNTVDTLIAQMYLPCKIGEWASWWHYRKTIIICCCLCIRLSLPNAKWTINANSQIIWPFELWTICKCITSIALRCAHFA